MEIMDASIVGLITSAICIFLLWKFQSVGILQTFLWTYRLERKKQFLVEDSFTCHKICYTEVN